MTTRANTEKDVSINKAEEIATVGRAEGELAKLLQSRRKYQVDQQKLLILKALAQNDDVRVFGNHKDNLIAMLAANKLGLSIDMIKD
jgi:hypothetical protein